MNKKKLILIMYIGVIALAVASVSVSVAWYATSRSLYVNSINISIDADRELEISTSKEDGFVDHIGHTEFDPTGVFIPVTTAHSSLWTSKQELDSPIFYDESNFSDVENFNTYSVAKEGYFSEKFYIRGDDDLWITIDPEKTFINANDEYNSFYAEYLYEHYQKSTDEHDAFYKSLTVEELHARLNDVVKAMRFSILIKDENEYSYTIIDPHYEEDTLLGGVLDNANDQYYDYYLKNNSYNEYYERVYGEVIGEESQYVYDDGLDEDSSFLAPNEAPSAFNARHKSGVKRFNLEESKKKGLEIVSEKAIDLKKFSEKTKPFHFKIKRNVPKEIVISIYIEGWDKDSVNYTMGAAFTSDLTFKIEREA